MRLSPKFSLFILSIALTSTSYGASVSVCVNAPSDGCTHSEIKAAETDQWNLFGTSLSVEDEHGKSTYISGLGGPHSRDFLLKQIKTNPDLELVYGITAESGMAVESYYVRVRDKKTGQLQSLGTFTQTGAREEELQGNYYAVTDLLDHAFDKVLGVGIYNSNSQTGVTAGNSDADSARKPASSH